MKKFLVLLLSILLLAGIASAEEEINDILGKPFPDFSVKDTEGNTFTLSEVLKDHEAVVINFWATWCEPCWREFPFLNEAYKEYKGRVAFIALSKEKKDTIEKIADYRKDNGIDFPMGRDEDLTLFTYVGGGVSVPKTLVVDRFGNTVFYHSGAFSSAGQVKRVLDTFLGDGYTQTSVLDGIPADIATRAYSASKARNIYPESGNYKTVTLHIGNDPKPVTGYIVSEDTIRLRIEIAPEDDVNDMTYLDGALNDLLPVSGMLDPERGVYVYDQGMPDPSGKAPHCLDIAICDDKDETGENIFGIYVFRGEEGIKELQDLFLAEGNEVTWEYAETEEKKENAPQAYLIHVMDQDGKPVPEVTVNFCTDEACVPRESDENGLVTFEGKPYKYHVQIIDVPEGYSWDESFEMYTTPEYGEWTLRIKKD